MFVPRVNIPIYANADLDGGDFFWRAGPIGVLLLHGFTATTTEVRLLGDDLFQAGYTVSAPLLPGHGTTPLDLNKQRWRNWTDCVERAYHRLREQCGTVFVAGESMGGLLTLHLAAHHPELAGILLFAPALSVDRIGLARLLAPFVAYLPKSNWGGSMPWKGYNVKPMRAAVELSRLQALVRSELKQVKQPTLIFQGKNDQTINPQSAQIVLDAISSTDKELVWLEESGHVIVLDRDLPFVTRRSRAFIERLSAPQSEAFGKIDNRL